MTIIFPTPETPALVQSPIGPELSYNEARKTAAPFREEDKIRAKYLVYATNVVNPNTEGFNQWVPDPDDFYAFRGYVAVDHNPIGASWAYIKSSTLEMDIFIAAATKKEDSIAAQHDGIVLKIWINRLLHLAITTSQLTGVNAYIEDQRTESNLQIQAFFIEFGFKTGHHIIAEYNERGRWEEILKLVDENVKSSTVRNP